MDADIQTLEQILNRILHAEPTDKAQAALLDQAYKGIQSAITALEQLEAQ
ncbi:hypothetical protein VB780_08190 [Leptolyngbya sp. CCNP1308]|nr:hypothetical protein [Leptolyngbya sp. CCNP1308]MEA5448539.1 hypothetical protein [Leptolyngbya sp. CCNP1308]